MVIILNIFLFNSTILLIIIWFFSLEITPWILVLNMVVSILTFIFNLNLLLNWKYKLILNMEMFRKFLIYYIILEALTELFFLLGYVFNFTIFYSLLFIFKLGVYPYIHYKYLIISLNSEIIISRVLIINYFFIFKVWTLVLLSWIPLNYQLSLITIGGSFIYLIYKFDLDLKDLFFKSLMLSSINLILTSLTFTIEVSFFYIIISTFLQFKSIRLLHIVGYNKEFLIVNIFFSILNGNPVYLFNLLKILVGVFISSLNLFISILYLTVSILFLTISFYKIFILNFKSTFYMFKNSNSGNHHIKILLTLPIIFINIFLNSIFLNIDILIFIIKLVL